MSNIDFQYALQSHDDDTTTARQMDVLWEKVSTHFLVNMGDLTTYTSDYQILDRGVICFVINNATIFARSCCDLISLFPCYIQTFMR